MFATGTPSPPKPFIKFVHDDSKCIPSAHTCGNIYVYVNQKTISGPWHHCMLTAHNCMLTVSLINYDLTRKILFHMS